MSVLIFERKNHIAYLTLNRPEVLNAINDELNEALEKAWLDFMDDDELWVAVITGTGRAFCSGFDIKERGRPDYKESESLGYSPLSCNVWKPIICAINGYATAAGWILAMESDIRIASETAEMALNEVRVGLPVFWVDNLFRYMTLGQALEILFTADPITAQRAYEIGFVNKVVSVVELMPTAVALAERICQNAPLAVRSTKELVYKSLHPTLHEMHYRLMKRCMEGFQNEDFKEAARAFAEKRKPKFKTK